MRTRASACVRACVRASRRGRLTVGRYALRVYVYIYISRWCKSGWRTPEKAPFFGIGVHVVTTIVLSSLLSSPLLFSLLLAKKEVVEIVSRILSGFQQISDVRKLERAMERVLEGRWWCYK